jgi:hypothetical protein
MERKLINIAIVNTFFEEKRNLLDSYYPFILKSFSDRSVCSLKDVSESIKNVFDFELPINSIKNILSRNPLVFQSIKKSKSEWEISLSSSGKTELIKLLEDEKKVEAKIEYFYSYFVEFSNSYLKTEYSVELIKELINRFIISNLLKISLEQLSDNESNGNAENFDKHFILFLAHINTMKPELVDTFDSLWKGSIIWNELKKEGFEEIDIKFKKHLNIFIDTNFALSLLELHNPIINQAAKELYSLILGIPNTNLYILDVTLREIHSLLDLYDILKDNFTDIEVDSVFYYLKHKGYSTLKMERLKDNLENELKSLKIEKIDTEALREYDQKTYASIYDYILEKKTVKNEKRPERIRKLEAAIEKSAHHDTSVIIHVLRHKDKYSRNLESSKSIFLTSSYTLYKNYGKISRKFESFPCVILDTTFTNILYLKNPQKNSKISLTQIIKTHCNYLIVDQSIWNTYVSIINQLKNDNEITVEDYTRLITRNQITQEYLLTTDYVSINKHEVKSILEKIKNRDEEKDNSLNEKEALVIKLTESNKELIESMKLERDERVKEKQEADKTRELDNVRFQKQLDALKRESDLKDYIAKQLENEYDPLSSKLFLFTIVCLLCVFLYFISDYIVTDDFISRYKLTIINAYIIRALIILVILFISGFALQVYNSNFFKFIFSRKKLKEDLRRKYIQVFESK